MAWVLDHTDIEQNITLMSTAYMLHSNYVIGAAWVVVQVPWLEQHVTRMVQYVTVM